MKSTLDELSIDACPFCKIIAGTGPATVIQEWDDALAIIPLNPVIPGHVIVIPKTHVADAGADPAVTASTAARAAELLAHLEDGNLITSRGKAATQTVSHLHIHVVPRLDNDELHLPWTGKDAGHRTVYAGEAIPEGVRTIFLAGPTPRSPDVPSWRPEAVKLILDKATEPTMVILPERRYGWSNVDKAEQYDWEHMALEHSDVILFWVPRNMETMPALTTNVEWGAYQDSGKVVLGLPPEGERNFYLAHQARRRDISVWTTLEETCIAALSRL